MRTWHTTFAVGVIATLAAAAVPSSAQQVTVGTPFRTQQDHFFENNSINWTGSLGAISSKGGPVQPYLTFSFGAPNLASPQFGSPQTNAGLTTNFAFLSKNAQINFGWNFGQGYTQSSVTQTPSVTLMNGQTGYVSDTSLTPFVISVVPVVGGFPVGPQPLQISGIEPDAPDPRIQALFQARADAQRQAQQGGAIPPPPRPQQPNARPMNAPDPVPAQQNQAGPKAGQASTGADAIDRLNAAQASSAGRPALSVAEAKRMHEQELAQGNGEMAALMERAQALEEDGKPNVAKIYYQQIVKHASGELQQQARSRLYELQGSK